MDERIKQEIEVLRQHYPALEYWPDGQWVKIPAYIIAAPGWSSTQTAVAFQIPIAFPGTPPYSFYVLDGLRYNSCKPNNFKEPAPTQPPFGGTWGVFSWQPEDGQWRPSANITAGSNLLDWVRGFAKRFEEGA